ncbi:hypothetical protein V8F20_002485 [Naviculisporaceae sp. PSN 640]
MIPMATRATVRGLLMKDIVAWVLLVLGDGMLVGTVSGIVEVVKVVELESTTSVVMGVDLTKVVVAEGAAVALSVGLRGAVKEVVSINVAGAVSITKGGRTPGTSGP